VWPRLFKGKTQFRTFSHRQWVDWVRQHHDGKWADWLDYVAKRYDHSW
ncbi:hypothetical protein LCGC14_2822130, partial [marine sediment metagenome]